MLGGAWPSLKDLSQRQVSREGLELSANSRALRMGKEGERVGRQADRGR